MMSTKLSTAKLTSIVKGIQNLYPITLADSSWDNTGLLVDSSYPGLDEDEESARVKAKILLTVDLTQSVVEESILSRANLVLAYHPFIFRGLKSVTHNDPQQSSLIKLIQHNISVYSPHTAIDSAVGGVNDWLCDGIKFSDGGDSVVLLEPSKIIDGAGMGRLLTLAEPTSINELIPKIKLTIAQPYVQIARPAVDKPVKTVAICAGSGGGLFKNVEADCYYTGELSHHELLYLKEKGSYVVACNHSNTERGFLKLLREQLLQEFDGTVEVIISETDKDPYEVV